MANPYSDQKQERSDILEFNIFVNKDNFFELSIVWDLSSDIIIIERLSNLESESSLDRKGFELSIW